MTRSTRWGWSAAIVVAALLIGVAIARAQSSQPRGDVVITRVDPDAVSKPFPLLSPGGGTLRVGGVYEISFVGITYVPGLGPRPRLFVMLDNIYADGWIQVEYGDGVKDKGAPNAELDPVVTLPGSVSLTNAQWLIHYTSIAAVSPRLNAVGPMAEFWPE